MGSSEDKCKWLHEQLENLPFIKHPFELTELPKRGIYFFYEVGETWGHGEDKPRIARVGTHKSNNFRSRIKEHFLLNEKKMNFNDMKPAPHDRSIFRKNIGRTILNREEDQYLEIWNKDLMSHANRLKYRSFRNIPKEKKVENEVTSILRANFSFKFIIIEDQSDRIGTKGLESSLIGTVARCELCKPSEDWFGNHSPVQKLRESGLWQVQHLSDEGIDDNDIDTISNAIEGTEEWIRIYKRNFRPPSDS